MSFERLDYLRKRNKELLTKLKNQTEKLQSLKIACPCTEVKSQSSNSSVFVIGKGPALVNGDAGDQAAGNGDSCNVSVTDAIVTVAVGGSHSNIARDALCKPATQIKTKLEEKKPACLDSEVCKPSTPAEDIISQNHLSEDTTYGSLLQDQRNSRPHGKFINMEQIPSVGVSLDKGRRVTFLHRSQELETAYDRQCLQPLLGYDWIAGLLDAENSLTERSEQFFSELRSFRQVNKDECVHSASSGFPDAVHALSPSGEKDCNEHEHTSDTHHCTFCYRINSRLFAAPLDPLAGCAVCRMPKARHPHTEREPAFVRVSIPRSTLLPTYRYTAHRRRSLLPSDSLGLPAHCLSGWSNSTLKPSSQMSRLDLRSSVAFRPTALTAPLALPQNQMDLSGSRVSGSQCSDQLLDVSRLTQYRFQYLDPGNTKPHNRPYPVF